MVGCWAREEDGLEADDEEEGGRPCWAPAG